MKMICYHEKKFYSAEVDGEQLKGEFATLEDIKANCDKANDALKAISPNVERIKVDIYRNEVCETLDENKKVLAQATFKEFVCEY